MNASTLKQMTALMNMEQLSRDLMFEKSQKKKLGIIALMAFVIA
jgi:hypothetical protein